MMNLTQLIEVFAILPVKVEAAEHHALEQVGKLVSTAAKDMLGHDQEGWKELAEYTLNEKARLDLPSPSPLLRTGEHIKNTIEYSVHGHTVDIGSNDQVAVWQEDGTKKMPPRPFLKTAALHNEDEIKAIVAENVLKALNNR